MASKFSSPFMAKSPLHGAYTSATGQGSTYVSNREAFQKLQDDIVEGAKEADKIFTDPENQAERLQKRIDRREERAGNKGADGRIINKTTGDVIADLNPRRTEFDGKTQKLRKRKEGFDKEIEKQKKEKRSQNFLTAAEKTEIVKQHFLGEEGKEEDWNALTPKQKKEVVLDYRTYYGFN